MAAKKSKRAPQRRVTEQDILKTMLRNQKLYGAPVSPDQRTQGSTGSSPTDLEALVHATVQSYLKYGTPTPPREEILTDIVATCPHCGKVGTVGKEFGPRRVNGQIRAQSWCKECRGGKDSHPTRNGGKLTYNKD